MSNPLAKLEAVARSYDRSQVEAVLMGMSRAAGRELAFSPLGECNPEYASLHRRIDDLLDRWQRCS